MVKIDWNEFKRVEIRIGTIIEAKNFPEAINPAYKIRVDLGEKIGIKKTSAQITALYSKEELIGKQVMVVANLHTKKIGPFTSECLITGFYKSEDEVVLAVPDEKIKNGTLLV